MKTPKPTKQTEAEICCFECDQGILRPLPKNYTATLKDGRQIIVPDVPMLVCDHCGDSVIGDEGLQTLHRFFNLTMEL